MKHSYIPIFSKIKKAQKRREKAQLQRFSLSEPTTPGDPPDNGSVVLSPPSPEMRRLQQAGDPHQGLPAPSAFPVQVPPLPPGQLEADTEQDVPVDTPLDGMEILDQLEREDETEPELEPSAPPSVRSRSPHWPAELPAQPSASVPALDPEIAALYEPVGPEDFHARRNRIDRQETQNYGPHRLARPLQPPAAPYQPPHSGGPADGDDREMYSQAFAVFELDSSALPPGWTFDEAGYLQLSDRCSDFWQIQSGCLIRHHVQPRHNLFSYEKDKDAPIAKEYLDPIRITVMRLANGQIEVVNDSGDRVRACQSSWTGCTVFQINGKTRKELCMYSNMPAKKLAKDEKSKIIRQQKKVDKGGISERHLSLEQKLQFQAAKQKELRSFFENQVWEFPRQPKTL